MESLKIFAENVERYDQWYEKHSDFFFAELAAIKKVIPAFTKGIEIGIGTGRFAASLGIKFGIDPIYEMLEKAKRRGIKVTQACGENIPYENASFDYALMTTTICFLDDIDRAFAEVARILQENGTFTVAFIDRESHLSKGYQGRTKDSFYSNALFYSSKEVIKKLEYAEFKIKDIFQTLLSESEDTFQCKPGYGQGAFVVINSEI